MKRRKFLKHTGHALAIPGIIGSFGFGQSPLSIQSLLKTAEETDRTLVLIYLSGGNDGLNTVIPLDQYEKYPKLRPDVILPESSLLKLPGTDLALHPSLTYMKSLFEENRMSLVQSVGYPDQNFSHFRSTDIWASGSRADEYLSSGWTGRYLNHLHPSYPEGYPNDQFTDPLAVEIGQGGSLLFQGPSASMSITINDPEDFYNLLGEGTSTFPEGYVGDKLQHIQLIAQQSQAYGQVVKEASAKVSQQKEYPSTYIANQLKIVSRLIAGGLKTPIYLVKIGGFDTHASQVEASDHRQGNHANLLAQVDGAVKAFMEDLKFLNVDDRVLGMTFSEFGRRIISNASNGTDHGAAAPLFVFGNEVSGGVFGQNPILPSTRSVSANVEQQFDFRQIYSSVLEQWFGMPNTDINSIMLEELSTIPIIGSKILDRLKPESDSFSVYPNPLGDLTKIRFRGNGSEVKIDLFDYSGQQIRQIYSGQAKGEITVDWNSSYLSPGAYLIKITGNKLNYTRKVIKR